MPAPFSAIIPFNPDTANAALALAHKLQGQAAQVLLAGPDVIGATRGSGAPVLEGHPGKGEALRNALAQVQSPFTVIQDAGSDFPGAPYAQLLAPLEADRADAVYAAPMAPDGWAKHLPTLALSRLTEWVTHARLTDPLSGLRAFRTEPLKQLQLTSTEDEIDSEILVKLAAQEYRVTEVTVPSEGTALRSVRSHLAQARTLVRYATVQNDADNAHEGYNTLARMESAPRYNAWLGRRFREHLGRRVLEVGAGIGTITRELEPGRELLIALEMEPFYVERLKNRFRDKPHVRPVLSGVERADWDRLAKEQIDSIVLSNVLEHIRDDAEAVRNFRRVLQPGGALLVLVPALPQLFGSMDEAVGHFRRYTPETLSRVLTDNGFTVESLEWMNLAGVPGWLLNGRLFRRRAIPPLQLRAYDALAPFLAQLESHVRLPLGLSLFAVARAREESGQ